jgi:uncharacterized protein (DUF302 family)
LISSHALSSSWPISILAAKVVVRAATGLVGEPMMTVEGLTTVPSAHGVKDTIDRLESDVKSKGMTIFARVDHAAGAKAAGLALRPTELLMFGNAKGGTPFMQANQTIGIDLPLKALAWEDADGKVWLSYNEPAWLAARHGLPPGIAEATQRLTAAIGAAAKTAAA